MFTLDYVRPVGRVLAASDLCSDLNKIYNSQNPIYGYPGEFYYFDYDNGFAKAVHKKYAPYLDEIYKIEALVNDFCLEKHLEGNFAIYITPKFKQPFTQLDSLTDIAVNISTQLDTYIANSNLKEIVFQNEILMQQLFHKYSPVICDLLQISSIKCQIDLFEEKSVKFCHNDFHNENIFVDTNKKCKLIDFEMALFHRSSTDVELINYSRFNLEFKIALLERFGAAHYKKMSQMLAIKNLVVLAYLSEKNGWKNNAEIKKFQILFYKN